MKTLVTVSLFALSISAFAQSDLNSMKQKANEKIDKKMTSLQEAKTCVNNATTTDKFKACKYDMHEDMKMQKMESMDDAKESMDDVKKETEKLTE